MSMNLHVKFDGQPFDLIQTPTWVTYLCLMNFQGEVTTQTARNGKRALYCYLQWLESTIDDITNEGIANHKTDLVGKINTCRKVEVYYL